MNQRPYSVVARTPSVAEYLHLRAVAGLSPFSEAAAHKGLQGTIFSALIIHEGSAVGMGRLIGDGGCFFQVVDIAVDPEHQRRGLGKTIMSALMAHVKENLHPSAYVSLIADVPANTLYEKFGFKATAPRSLGMAYHVDAST